MCKSEQNKSEKGEIPNWKTSTNSLKSSQIKMKFHAPITKMIQKDVNTRM